MTGEHMRLRTFALTLTALTVMLLSAPVRADVVFMKNGDRLTGEVMVKEDGTLMFRTGYAGTIGIRWDRIRQLRTDEAVLIIHDDGTELPTRGITVDGEKATIAPPEGETPVIVGSTGVAAIRRVSRPPEGSGELSGRVNVSMKFESGNTDSDDFGAVLDVTYLRRPHRIRVLGELDKDRKAGETTKEDWRFGGAYNYFLTGKLYSGGWLLFRHDEFGDLKLRTHVGPYIGYQFFESMPLNFLVEAGAVLAREEYYTAPGNNYWGPAWYVSFDTYLVRDLLQFYHEQFGHVSAENTDKWLLLSFTGLRVPLFGGLVGSAEVKLDYDNDPSGETDHTQATYRLKLGYAW